jgi:Leucine-rich repeat (LRR) protein
MSNSINNKVPSLSVQASSCVLNHLEESIQGKKNQDLWGMEREEACKAGLMQVWEDLLFHPNQHPYLKLTMEKVQDLVIKEFFKKFKCVCAIFDPLQVDPRNAISLIKKSFIEACISGKTIPEALLQESVVQAFQKLANTFGLQSISTDFNAYKPVCDEQDKALELIWSDPDMGIAAKLGIDAPHLTKASQIRVWMADPKNARVLRQITELNFLGCDLKVIPIEILTLPELTRLRLVSCGIKVIPEEVGTSQLEYLDLGRNQIQEIPEALATSQLIELNLGSNQIQEIPKALATSQLTYLNLNRNQIQVIPKALATSRLTKLDLGGNQIEVLPEELATSQLTELYLQRNRIKFLSEVFAKSQLKVFCLGSNPLLFTSYNYGYHDVFTLEEIFIIKSDFNSYNCLSDFSKLFKICSSETLDLEAIKTAFARLKHSDQCLICEMVYREAGIISKDLKWGEHHIFDNMDRFFMALKRAVVTKFNRLSSEQKNRMCAEVYNLAGRPQTHDVRWGEHYALDCIPRALDAMELAGL